MDTQIQEVKTGRLTVAQLEVRVAELEATVAQLEIITAPLAIAAEVFDAATDALGYAMNKTVVAAGEVADIVSGWWTGLTEPKPEAKVEVSN